MILRRSNPFCQVVVPDHKELERSTLHSIIRRANLSVDEFVKVLGEERGYKSEAAKVILDTHILTF